jgi:hypothetical protein
MRNRPGPDEGADGLVIQRPVQAGAPVSGTAVQAVDPTDARKADEGLSLPGRAASRRPPERADRLE